MGSTQPRPNLHDLTREAYDEIRQATHRSGRSRSATRKSNWPISAGLSIVVVLVALVAWHFGVFHSPTPSRGRIQADLEKVLDQARNALESERRDTGRLPDAVPNASLAAIVRYERHVYDHGEGTYRLSASSAGITVYLDGSGNREVRHER